MKLDFVVDNMSLTASPIYKCNVQSKPLVFKPGKTSGKMVKAKRSLEKSRYIVPLYPITIKTLNQVNSLLYNTETNEHEMFGVTLCLQGDKIGLTCHNSKLKEKLLAFS